jgi:hypothetical protein
VILKWTMAKPVINLTLPFYHNTHAFSLWSSDFLRDERPKDENNDVFLDPIKLHRFNTSAVQSAML